MDVSVLVAETLLGNLLPFEAIAGITATGRYPRAIKRFGWTTLDLRCGL